MAASGDSWYKDLFESDYVRFWLGAGRLSPERTTREIDFLLGKLNLSPVSRILDLCCGQSRHSVELAKRGFSVVGLDLSPTLLAMAREAATAAGLDIEWIEADMREVPTRLAGSFDAAINMYTA